MTSTEIKQLIDEHNLESVIGCKINIKDNTISIYGAHTKYTQMAKTSEICAGKKLTALDYKKHTQLNFENAFNVKVLDIKLIKVLDVLTMRFE